MKELRKEQRKRFKETRQRDTLPYSYPNSNHNNGTIMDPAIKTMRMGAWLSWMRWVA